MKNGKRSPVDVVVPELKLDVADLAYLASLESGIRCYVKDRVRDKLMFLGLVTYGEIPPCKNEVRKYEEMRPVLAKAAADALRDHDWIALYEAAYDLKNESKPKAEKGYAITTNGLDILRRGRTKTMTAAKGGCL